MYPGIDSAADPDNRETHVFEAGRCQKNQSINSMSLLFTEAAELHGVQG